MSEFKKPWIDIQKKFTTSELVIMSWSSKEISESLHRDTDFTPKQSSLKDFLENQIGNPDVEEGFKSSDLTMTRNSVEKALGEDTDMRQFKGKDLWKYFQSQGIHFPIISKSRD